MGSLNWDNVLDSTAVDEVHPANNVMYEDVFGRPIMQSLHGLPECMLQINAWFLVFFRA